MIFGLESRDAIFLAVMACFLLLMFTMVLLEFYKIYLRNRNKKNGNGPK